MKKYYIINMSFATLLAFVSIAIPVLGFMTLEATATNLAIICLAWTLGTLGSYAYYSNAQDIKKGTNK